MSAIRVKYLVSGFLLTLCVSVFSQTHQFKNITTEDGLPSSECYKIIQDKKGYIWISTDAGICRYNGKEFKTFTTSDGLPSNTIFEILEDKYGRIWGGCFHGGIFYILNDQVHTIQANKYLQDQSNKNKEIIRKMVLDDKSILHVGTTQNYYQIYPENNYGLVVEYPEEDTSFTLLKTIGNEVVFSRIISGERSGQFTKHKILDNNKQYVIWPSYNIMQSWLAHYHAIKTQKGEIIFVLGNVLRSYDYQNIFMREYPDNIINLYEDKDFNLWIGFFKTGYFMYPKGDLNEKPVSGLIENAVGGFLVDREGGLWINTLDKGVLYSNNTQIFTFPQLQGQNIPAITTFNDQLFMSSSLDKLWSIENDQPIILRDPKDGFQMERMYFTQIGNKMYKTGGNLIRIDDDGSPNNIHVMNGVITQMTMGKDSLWIVNHEELSAITENRVISKHSLPSRGFCVHNTSRNELFVGCMNGLYHYLGDNQFVKIPLTSKDKNIRISFITEDINHDLVISTKSNGVFIRRNHRWININQSHGLASDLCNHIYCAKDSTYYVSTNKGMSIIKEKNGQVKIQTINITNGIPANEVNMVIEYKDHIYLATENGVCFYPKTAKVFNSTLPALVTKEIKMNDVGLVNKSVYSHFQNDLYFSCDVLSYQSPKLNKIKYQLFPVDQEPKYSKDFDIHYDNLPAGNYTLTIQGVNNNGVEGLPAVYRFRIQPAFWTTWWFILTISFCFILGMYVIIKKRIGYLHKREQEKTALKEKIVEYHYTALRAQMNPHFIFNVINSIQLYVLNNQPKEAYNYLSKFSKLIRRVLENSKQKLITLADELETLELYMELEKIRLEGNISFNVKVDSSIDKEKILVPSMIIQPVLENSVWHGIVPLNKSRSGKINLIIQHQTESLLITIRDNGIGIDLTKSKTHESFGLNLIRDRLSLLNGPTGIEIANLLDDKNQVQGVEVTILLPLIRNT